MPTNEFSGEKSPNPIVVKVINEKYIAYGNTSYGVSSLGIRKVLAKEWTYSKEISISFKME